MCSRSNDIGSADISASTFDKSRTIPALSQACSAANRRQVCWCSWYMARILR